MPPLLKNSLDIHCLMYYGLSMTNDYDNEFNRVKRARDFAIMAHKDQKYGAQPYFVHLHDVQLVLREADLCVNITILSAAWLHDVVEDTNVTINAIEDVFGTRIANIVNCLTNPKDIVGRNNKHKFSYPRIAGNTDAITVKLADRIANSLSGDKLDMYKTEYPYFRETLTARWRPTAQCYMWEWLDELMEFSS